MKRTDLIFTIPRSICRCEVYCEIEVISYTHLSPHATCLAFRGAETSFEHFDYRSHHRIGKKNRPTFMMKIMKTVTKRNTRSLLYFHIFDGYESMYSAMASISNSKRLYVNSCGCLRIYRYIPTV